MGNETKDYKYNNEISNKILGLEKQVSLGLWIQVVGNILELTGLLGLQQMEEDENPKGEQHILAGVWAKTIGQILEAISVSKQISETDKMKLLEEQKIAIAGDFLVSLGSAIEVIGGLEVLEEESVKTGRLVP